MVVLSDIDFSFVYRTYAVQKRIQNLYKGIILGLSPNGKAQDWRQTID